MGEQSQSFLAEVRGIAPGFVVGYARPFLMKGAGTQSDNRPRFPQLAGLGLVDAAPDTVALVAALSANYERTVGDVIEEVAAREGVEPKRLRRFSTNLVTTGFLVANPPVARWTEAPTLDPARVAALTPVGDLLLQVPEGSGLIVDGGRFLWFDHGGTLRLALSPDEMLAVRELGEPRSVDGLWEALRAAPAPPSLTRDDLDALVARLRAAGLVRAVAPAADDARTAFDPIEVTARAQILEATLEAVAEHERASAERPGTRVAVVPVNDDHNMAPLSLGLLVAYAQELDGGRLRDRYDFLPLFLAEEDTLLRFTERPAVFLFSNYIWNHERNLRLANLLKEANPANVMVHGGPSTPKYAGDCAEFFAEHVGVDVTVRGEGEATFAALLDALGPDLDVAALAEVEGISYRTPDGLATTDDRDRIADLDTIPSPYLLGLFEPFGRVHSAAVVESNRGCPYGCTFCDWGSATLSRIRKFDMDRVKAELEWFSKNELLFVSLCDANFGIFERDIEIAQHIADMKAKYDYPKTAALNYAKNTMKHLRPIIEIFSEAGLTIEPTVALQSTDPATLKVIKRSNIKLEKYDELADGFRRSGLPLATDVMMGLPGSTLVSFKGDLQACTDRDVRARANPTVLLPNSPMNDPAYREEHGIVAKPHETVKQTKTFSRADFDDMERIRVAFYAFDNFGILRHVARFVRSETGIHEVDFYDRISLDAVADPQRWPVIAALVRMMNSHMAPPSSWSLLLSEVGRYCVEVLGVEPGSALDTVLAVQAAHLPAPDRTFPVKLDLPHDHAAWHDAMLEARTAHRLDWERTAPRLATFPPGTLEVRDPNDVSNTMVGKAIMVMAWNIVGWDMESRVARSQLATPIG